MFEILKKLREDQGWTQDELAKKASVSRATIIKLESGVETEVKIGTLRALASALNRPVSIFFTINI